MLRFTCAGMCGSVGGTEMISNAQKHDAMEVEVCSIDETIGTLVTFIAMDIEGSELEALKGAERTIRNYMPKLAISIYHKIEDFWEIPLYPPFRKTPPFMAGI